MRYFSGKLVSNAVDASQKIKTLSTAGEFKENWGDLQVTVKIDKEAKTLTISDMGVGMTADEIDRYINQIAFSAEEFVNKYKDKMDSGAIIGHFGLGFYSAFMVAAKVEIVTRSFREADENKAVRWECDGQQLEFTLSATTRAERGTDIILHLNEDSMEVLEYGASRNITQ